MLTIAKVKISMTNYLKSLDREKLTDIIFQITILASFWGSVLLPFTVPGIGEVYLFRIALALFICLFLYDGIKRKYNPFKNRTKIDYLTFITVGIMIFYSIISLGFAINFMFSFRKIFNFCFDIAFFISILLFINSKKRLIVTLINCTINILLLQLMGVYEVFFGGIFYDFYNNYKRFVLFDQVYQFPVVSYGNTNNYISSIMFCIPIILAFLLSVNIISKKKQFKVVSSILIVIMTVLTSFLADAAKARLCQVTMIVILVGFIFYVVVFQIKQIKILAMILLSLTLILSMERYMDLRVGITKLFDKSVESPETKDSFNNIGNKIKEEFVIVDEVTGDTEFNTSASGGVRVALILFSFDKFVDSKLLGVGLGNTEQLAKQVANEQFGGLWSIHCFPIRLVSDLGIFVLIPTMILLFFIIKELIINIRKYFKTGYVSKCIYIFTITSILSCPFIMTSSSDAQDLLSMWLWLAVIILLVTRIPTFIFEKADDNLEL